VIIEYDSRGVILGYVPLPNGDAAGTNFAFGSPDNQYIYMEGADGVLSWGAAMIIRSMVPADADAIHAIHGMCLQRTLLGRYTREQIEA
jgi:hypothetical protein